MFYLINLNSAIPIYTHGNWQIKNWICLKSGCCAKLKLATPVDPPDPPKFKPCIMIELLNKCIAFEWAFNKVH